MRIVIVFDGDECATGEGDEGVSDIGVGGGEVEGEVDCVFVPNNYWVGGWGLRHFSVFWLYGGREFVGRGGEVERGRGFGTLINFLRVD